MINYNKRLYSCYVICNFSQTDSQHLTRIMIIIINPDFFVVAYEYIITIYYYFV